MKRIWFLLLVFGSPLVISTSCSKDDGNGSISPKTHTCKCTVTWVDPTGISYTTHVGDVDYYPNQTTPCSRIEDNINQNNGGWYTVHCVEE